MTVMTGPATTLTGVLEVNAGGSHTCARASSALYCWGDNEHGQLGIGNNDDQDVAVPVLSGVAHVAAGDSHTCILTTSLAVRCWGSDYGNGASAGTNEPGATIITNVVELDAGLKFTCVRALSGSVSCWGLDANGSLGNGDAGASTTPNGIAELGGAMSLGLGFLHGCATVGGAMSCWGSNDKGQLAAPTASVFQQVPVSVVLP